MKDILTRPVIQWSIIAVAGIGAIILRLWDLTADPPNQFAGLGQALITDPYHITLFARNKVLYGDWDPFDYDRWVAFRVSLVSMWSYLIFAVAGVSRYTANLSSVLLNLIASITLIFTIFRSVPRESATRLQAVLVATLTLGLSHLLITYSRAPFLENGLLALAALTMAIVVLTGRTTYGAIAAGALTALCPLAGKLFGVVILFPALCTLLLINENKLKATLYYLAGAIVTAALWYLFVLGDNTGAFHTYLEEQSSGLYGFPPGLTSPKMFFQQLISFGGENQLMRFHFFLPVLFSISAIALSVHLIGRGWSNAVAFLRERPALAFFLLWTIAAVGSLMIFQYRPLRYGLFALVPMLGFVSCTLAELWHGSLTSPIKRQASLIWLAMVVLMAVWHTTAHVWYASFGDELTRDNIERITWIALAISAPLSAGLLWMISNRWNLSLVTFRWVSGLAVTAMAILHIGMSFATIQLNTHDLQRWSREIPAIIGSSAVLTGPHAPNLVMDNNLKCVIYSFGLKYDDSDLFDRFPITHIATDEGNLVAAQDKFEIVNERSFEVVRDLLRDATIRVSRVASENPKTEMAPLTDIERSRLFTLAQRKDSALFYAEEFVERHPENVTALRVLLERLMQNEMPDSAMVVVEKITEMDPRGSWSLAFCARALRFIGSVDSTGLVRGRMEQLLMRAQELNPACSAYYEDMVRN